MRAIDGMVQAIEFNRARSQALTVMVLSLIRENFTEGRNYQND